MNKKILITFILSCISLALFYTSCSSDDDNERASVNLSTTQVTAKVHEEFSVEITLSQLEKFQTIVIEKTISGKKVEAYTKTLNVADTQFPYTFTETAIPDDETGVVVYSFYGIGINGERLDASDAVLTLNVTQLYTLLKYDWKPISQIIQKEEYAEDYVKDDVHRFNEDLRWEMDWGTIFSTEKIETLNSFCAWKMIGTEEKIDSIFMIKYDVFSPTEPIVTKYKVVRIQDQEMVLQSIQDLTKFGFGKEEVVKDTYAGVPKTSDFTPYRGSNPDSYIIPDCNPGSY